MKTLKSEEVHLWEYRTMADVQKRIPYFIEDVYNQKRLHSSLGYRPPCEFAAMITLTQNPCQRTLSEFSNSHYGFNLAGPWGLFLKDATQILAQLVERPRGFE